jgi:hypothetical protein
MLVAASLLPWAQANGLPLSERTVKLAALGRHLEARQWLHKPTAAAINIDSTATPRVDVPQKHRWLSLLMCPAQVERHTCIVIKGVCIDTT